MKHSGRIAVALFLWAVVIGVGAQREPSFFALGPMIGGYVGLDFTRPGKDFNFQVGLTPYVTPLFSVDDPAEHRGVVAGGLVDALFRWGLDE